MTANSRLQYYHDRPSPGKLPNLSGQACLQTVVHNMLQPITINISTSVEDNRALRGGGRQRFLVILTSYHARLLAFLSHQRPMSAFFHLFASFFFFFFFPGRRQPTIGSFDFWKPYACMDVDGVKEPQNAKAREEAQRRSLYFIGTLHISCPDKYQLV